MGSLFSSRLPCWVKTVTKPILWMWKVRSGHSCEVRGTQEQIWAVAPSACSWWTQPSLGASHQGAWAPG